MKLLTLLLMISLIACGEKTEQKDAKPETPKSEISVIDHSFVYDDVKQVEVWFINEDKMNYSAFMSSSLDDCTPFLNIISNEEIGTLPDCRFIGGITYTKSDKSVLMTEFNTDGDCNYISYFDADQKPRTFRITPDGIKLLISLKH